MTFPTINEQATTPRLTNGAGAAAVFSAGLGSLTLAVLAIIGDHSHGFAKLMIYYTPTGPLSGVSTTAIAVWLITWFALDTAWKRREIPRSTFTLGLWLMAISFVLTFPPVSALF